MEFIQKLQSLEKKCEKQTIVEFKNPLLLNEKLLNFYFNLNKEVAIPDDHELIDFAVIIINVKLLKSFTCLSTILKKGYYCECQSISRDIFELVYLQEYLIKNPEEAKPWFQGKAIKHRNVQNELDVPTELRELYGVMCDFTHPNIKGAKGNLIFSGKKIYVRHGPKFHKATAHAILIQQILFTYGAAKELFEFFKNYNCFNLSYEKQMNKISKKIGKEVAVWEKLCSNPEYVIFPITKRS